MKALGIAATGMLAQQTNVDVISNNIANANTTGFKSSRAAFQDLIYQSVEREGALTSENGTARPTGIDLGLGVQTSGTVRLNTQGGLQATENQLDMAIQGEGYFTVALPDGSRAFTRDGSFQLSAEGQLVTLQGYELDPGIVVPANTVNVEISETGTVMAYVENDPAPVELGQLALTTFVNEGGLKPLGNNLLAATTASGDPLAANPGDPGVGVIRQGYLEASNVNIIQQITDLIAAQRAYEMNSKAIETADQMMTTTNQIK
ncbi:flagellar basal-body rod protein FlgG [Brevirhabdus pacifica]|uniref:Flagellar basal-body rod protein FlgG n=2 Tax=Brevirhabdus pacifica TaxID=1267768 RepID=A0A1U7DGT8_9RHOB|nr:flagellar basal-body rod protein FlgG [Brevirhabdus pacifica]APX89214.1 flagellar basal-body rod protein FlgG [Brevirhabdus pacifica]OWU76739.1 flagellar basal body rod protein FlgG [Loktanella sp. 22II-4b]PJJ86183.1 flagellar basal-body rod protein FlgG [Brevirhabdus pacifica]